MSDQSSSVRSPHDDSCDSSGRRKAVPTGDYVVGSSTAEESALPEFFGRYEVRRLAGRLWLGDHRVGSDRAAAWIFLRDSQVHVSRTDARPGTPHRRADRQYSLGVVLYYMLCGQFPFRAKSVDELVREIREDEPQPPRQLDHEIPPELERICLKALSKSLRRRYSNATDMATDLHRVLSAAAPDQRSPAKRYSPSQTDPGSGTLQWEHAGAKVKSKSREAERRQVTLVYAYCELTVRGEPLDPEERLAILQECQNICEDAVAHLEGTIIPSDGKGHLMCFGYPADNEDAARRAVLTGMGIFEVLRPLQARLQQKQIERASWVTVHTGLALVGAIGQERHNELSIVGEVRDVVSRLDTVAPPEGVVITEATYRLVHGYFLFDDTTMSLCRLKRTQGRSDEAGQMLADVHHRFTEGLHTPDLVEAKRLLDDLS